MKYLDRRERLFHISTNPETLVGSTTGRGTRKNSSSQGSLTVEGYADGLVFLLTGDPRVGIVVHLLEVTW
jgi:hypothetical protein